MTKRFLRRVHVECLERLKASCLAVGPTCREPAGKKVGDRCRCGSIISTSLSCTMKHFFRIKRKKSPKPPQQPISPGIPPSIATGSGSFQPAPVAVPEGVWSCRLSGDPEADYSNLIAALDKTGVDTNVPQIIVEGRADEDQGFPPSEYSTSGIAIGGTDFENGPISERS